MHPDLAQRLVSHCPVALSLHDEFGAFCGASDECERVFGRSHADLLTCVFAELVDARDRDRTRDAWNAAALRGEPQALEFRLAGAAEVWLAADLRRVAAGGPEAGQQIACAARRLPGRLAGALVDTSELADAALARRHRDILVEMLPGMVWYGQVAADLQTYRLSYLSDYLLTMTGYTREQWVDTPGFWRSIIHPDDRERTLSSTAAMMRGELERGPHYRLRASDGRYLWVQSSMHIERDAAGQPVRMYGLTLDVTAHVEIERENQEIHRELAIRAGRILELSAPILPLGAGVLLLPLIGAMDPARSEHAFSSLLAAVQGSRARRVIIDLTGVGEVDRESVLALVRATEAVRLLGARSLLTGLQPAVAMALLALDIPLNLGSYPSIAEALRAP